MWQLKSLSRISKDRSTIIYSGLLLFLSALGYWIILYTTTLGAGLSDDSYFYIKPARDILSGSEFQTDPSFPPLVPLLLAGLHIFRLEPLIGFRYLNAAGFGLNILLVGILLRKTTHSRLVAVMGALLTLLSETLIISHSWALSEASFLTISLLGAYSLVNYFEHKKITWIMLSAILFGLGALTRYIGISFIASGLVTIWLYSKDNLRKKSYTSLLFAIISGSLVMAYLLHNWIMVRSLMGPRPFHAPSISISFVEWAFYNVLIWFIPGRLVKGKEILSLIGFLVFCISGISAYIGLRRERANQTIHRFTKVALIGLFAWATVFNFFILTLSALFISPGFFDPRYLSVIYLFVLLLLISGFSSLWYFETPKFRTAIISLLAVFLVISLYRTYDTVQTLHKDGLGYASSRWHISETVAFLNKHPNTPVVSTAHFGLYFWTGRLPLPISHFKNISMLYDYLRRTKGYLVLIDSMPTELYGYNEHDLTSGAVLVYQFSEGAVYHLP
jgi:hypothetical protein